MIHHITNGRIYYETASGGCCFIDPPDKSLQEQHPADAPSLTLILINTGPQLVKSPLLGVANYVPGSTFGQDNDDDIFACPLLIDGQSIN